MSGHQADLLPLYPDGSETAADNVFVVACTGCDWQYPDAVEYVSVAGDVYSREHP